MYDVVAMGEYLIDFAMIGKSETGAPIYEQNPGGAPVNVLAALQRLGKKTAFIGKVGNDMHGLFLRDVLLGEEIASDGLIISPDVYTTLAFVGLGRDGERSFSFARKPGADTTLRAGEIPAGLIDNCRVFHFGSLSLTDEPARSATLEALKTAKASGCVVSYDPNYRAPLWPSETEAIDQMRSVLEYVDVIKLSDEETHLLTPEREPEKAATFLIEQGIDVAVVTCGARGAFGCTRKGRRFAPGFQARAVDTTGAGDSFWGGVLSQLLESAKRPAELTLEELEKMLVYGNAVASLCVEGRGAILAMPSPEAVARRLGGL